MTDVAKIPKQQVAQASEAWEAFLRAYGVLNTQFQADPIWKLVSAHEYDVLYTLAKANCSLSQSELLDAVTLSQPSVSRLLRRMEARGLVRRRSSQDDGRSHDIELTEKGRALQREVGREHGRHVAEGLFAHLDEGEVIELQRLCTKMAAKPSSQDTHEQDSEGRKL